MFDNALLPWTEYNPKAAINRQYKDFRFSPRFQTTNALRWHFFVDSKFIEELQTQSIGCNKETFSDFVFDTNDFILLKNGYWLLLRDYDHNHEPIWRLRKVVKSGEELVWTELKGDNEILKELSRITCKQLVTKSVCIAFFPLIIHFYRLLIFVLMWSLR